MGYLSAQPRAEAYQGVHETGARSLIGTFCSPATDAADEWLFTPRAVEILERSCAEARMLKRDYIAEEHLLLAIVYGHGGGVAKRVLANLGVDCGDLRTRILDALAPDRACAI